MLLTAIFFSFSSIGFIVDILGSGKLLIWELFVQVGFSGLVAIGYVHFFTRNWKFFPLVILFQVAFIFFIPKGGGEELVGDALKSRLLLDGLGAMAVVVLSYVFFVIFISSEGRKQFSLQTEMNLAREMHAVLVPDISFRNRELEIYGRSIPAEEVGGDLLDVYQKDSSVTAYIADVSGHGVAAGLLMGMFKSAMHSNLQKNLPLTEILNETNRALYRLKKRAMFLTCACIRFSGNRAAEFSVAGHLPILHYRAQPGSVEQLILKQIPLSVKADFQFITDEVNYSPGDLFVLLTDGLIEVTNRKDKEFGLERFQEIILQNRRQPLNELFDAILKEINQHGAKKDDQTLMLIRSH